MCIREQRKERLNLKVATWLVTKGGFFDDLHGVRYRNKYDANYYLHHGIDSKKRMFKTGYISQEWRAASDFSIALKKAVRDYHIPISFLKRHIKYISRFCVWQKSTEWNDYSNGQIRVQMTTPKHWKGLKNSAFGGDHIVLCSDNKKTIEVSVNETKIIDGISYSRRVTKEVEGVTLQDSRRMGIIVPYVNELYLNILYRYQRRYGIDCKMCNKNVKPQQPTVVCFDMLKYQTSFCHKCMARFCTLTEGTRIKWDKKTKGIL